MQLLQIPNKQLHNSTYIQCFNNLSQYLSKGETGTAVHPTSNKLLEEYKEGNYNFPLGRQFGIYNSLMSPKGTIPVQVIPGYGNCIGLLTSANEAIVLKCHEKQNEVPGCFDIINLSSTENKGLLPTDEVSNLIWQ